MCLLGTTEFFIRRAFTDGRQYCRRTVTANRRRPATIFGVHPLYCAGRVGAHRGDRCSLCILQRGSERPAPCSGGKLERLLVSVIGVCGDPLHRKRDLCRLCGRRLVARRVCLGHLAATRIPRRHAGASHSAVIAPAPHTDPRTSSTAVRQLTNILLCANLARL